MKFLIFTLMLTLVGCGPSSSAPSEAEQREIAQRRFRASGVCGDAGVARALSTHQWCAVDNTADDQEVLVFNSDKCSVVQTVKRTIKIQNEAGAVVQTQIAKDEFKGRWHIDSSTHRPLHISLEEVSPIYHTVSIEGAGDALTLTDDKYVPCASETAEEPEQEVVVEGGTEI